MSAVIAALGCKPPVYRGHQSAIASFEMQPRSVTNVFVDHAHAPGTRAQLSKTGHVGSVNASRSGIITSREGRRLHAKMRPDDPDLQVVAII
jgi:hypothetical protein